MREALEEVPMGVPAVPLIANVRAAAITDPGEIRALLVSQVTGSVRWRESVGYMAQHGVTETWEIGGGKALSGMVRRIERDIVVRNVATPEDVAAAVAALQNG
jgi:[acyl-carrier-protein] S-malonyltransferase